MVSWHGGNRSAVVEAQKVRSRKIFFSDKAAESSTQIAPQWGDVRAEHVAHVAPYTRGIA
jgi:hypothetical protein